MTTIQHAAVSAEGSAPSLLDRIAALEAAVSRLAEAVERGNPESHLPEECQLHKCGYYTHYLAYGGPDLTHEGFHAAEANAEAHMRNCTRSERGPCPVCIRHEQRVRA